MAFYLASKGEDYVLRRALEQTHRLNTRVRVLTELQAEKKDTVAHMVHTPGGQTRESATEKLRAIISRQTEENRQITKILNHLEKLLSLLIHLEEFALAIHSEKNQDDLAAMVSLSQMPIKKFRDEIEHVKLISASFDINRVELGKQLSYLDGLREHEFAQSEEAEEQLTEDEIVNILQIKEFCDDLHRMVTLRLKGNLLFSGETDRAAEETERALAREKLCPGIFGHSLLWLVRKLCAESMSSRKSRKMVGFLIVFLLSRLHKYNKNAYYSSLRAAILCYSLVGSMGFAGQRRIVVAGSALLARFVDIDPKRLNRKETEELRVIQKSYQTVNQLFRHELGLVADVLSHYHDTGETSEDLAWVKSGAEILGIVYRFDEILTKSDFGRQSLDLSSLKGSHADFLSKNWQKLIGPGLRLVHDPAHELLQPQDFYSQEHKITKIPQMR